MKRLEIFVESIILASRWLLVVFYIGLGLALALYAITFGVKLWDFASHLTDLGETETILKILGLIDAALIACNHGAISAATICARRDHGFGNENKKPAFLCAYGETKERTHGHP